MTSIRLALLVFASSTLLGAVGRAETLTIVSPVSYAITGSFTYNSVNYSSEGAGNIQTALLNGVPIPYMYCVDISHVIWVPGTYSADVNDDGYIYNNTLPGSGAQLTGSNLTNAGNIGYLMATQSVAAEGVSESALQAAIWEQVYGVNFTYHSSNSNYAQYQSYINLLNATTNTSFWASQVLWINPRTRNGYYAQAQVGYQPHHAPLPASLALFVSGMPGLLGLGWFLKRNSRTDVQH